MNKDIPQAASNLPKEVIAVTGGQRMRSTTSSACRENVPGCCLPRNVALEVDNSRPGNLKRSLQVTLPEAAISPRV